MATGSGAFTLYLLGRQSTDPFEFPHCAAALLIANQGWGSNCHAHRYYCFLLFFSMVKLISILSI